MEVEKEVQDKLEQRLTFLFNLSFWNNLEKNKNKIIKSKSWLKSWEIWMDKVEDDNAYRHLNLKKFVGKSWSTLICGCGSALGMSFWMWQGNDTDQEPVWFNNMNKFQSYSKFSHLCLLMAKIISQDLAWQKPPLSPLGFGMSLFQHFLFWFIVVLVTIFLNSVILGYLSLYILN